MYQSSPYLFVRADGIRLSLLVLWYTSLSNREDLPHGDIVAIGKTANSKSAFPGSSPGIPAFIGSKIVLDFGG
jgi:hypothetical protein